MTNLTTHQYPWLTVDAYALLQERDELREKAEALAAERDEVVLALKHACVSRDPFGHEDLKARAATILATRIKRERAEAQAELAREVIENDDACTCDNDNWCARDPKKHQADRFWPRLKALAEGDDREGDDDILSSRTANDHTRRRAEKAWNEGAVALAAAAASVSGGAVAYSLTNPYAEGGDDDANS